MNEKQVEEVELVMRLFAVTDGSEVRLDPADRPDVIADLHGERIGIEVTTLHSDERPETRGSLLRATQETATKAAGGKEPAAWVGAPDLVAALTTRIKQKIDTAAGYNGSGYDELWLLVAAGLPRIGSVAPTITLLPPDPQKLNNETNDILCDSRFTKCYFYDIMRKWLYLWSPVDAWKQIKVNSC